MVVVDEEAFRRLAGSIAAYRVERALPLGDVPATVTYARLPLDLVPEDDHRWCGVATASEALTKLTGIGGGVLSFSKGCRLRIEIVIN